MSGKYPINPNWEKEEIDENAVSKPFTTVNAILVSAEKRFECCNYTFFTRNCFFVLSSCAMFVYIGKRKRIALVYIQKCYNSVGIYI